MSEFLKDLAEKARRAVDDGAYEVNFSIHKPLFSFTKAIANSANVALITEIKFASPSMGTIRNYSDPVKIAREMIDAGCVGLSVLTQPYRFEGNINYLANIRLATDTSLLMKDVVISDVQIQAAKKIGADAVLLISSLFSKNLCEGSLDSFVDKAHNLEMEVLLETHTEEEFQEGVKSRADLIGINNRNLDTMQVDLRVTENILRNCEKNSKLVVSESGISGPGEVRHLRSIGVDAFLVGTSIMKSDNIKEKVRELVTVT